MSSYNITVNSVSSPLENTAVLHNGWSDTSGTTTCNIHPYGYDICWQPTTYYWWPSPRTVYMYQLVCPECGQTNWGEIDKPVECSGRRLSGKPCKAVLKAVSKKADYEIPVG